MRKLTAFTLATLLALTGAAYADDMKTSVQKALPQTRVEEVRETPIPGLYEVTADRNILYLSGDRRYLIVGEILDLKTSKNLTADRRMQVLKVDWKLLPLDLAIRYGQSDKKKLALFLDPDCPYCHKAYEAVKDLKDVESYVFLYPLPSHRDAQEKCAQVLCSKDKAAALDKVMRGESLDTVPKDSACTDRLEKSILAANALRLAGTPTFIFYPDGQMMPGFVPPEEIGRFFTAEGGHAK